MNILVTGGMGYIGTHTVVELLEHDHTVIIVDIPAVHSKEILKRIKELTGKDVIYYEGDVCDSTLLRAIFLENGIDAVIHLAGLKSVGESVKNPLAYYRNNLDSALSVCEVMSENNVKKLIFSSSATVYGIPEELPIREDSRVGVGITNPYGQTKYFIEQILRSIINSDPEWEITSLRYFNPIGAHSSGRIGEDPVSTPSNLMPYLAQVAVGRLDMLDIFGDDYNTDDGTALRDYVHIVDLAKGHVAALEHLKKGAVGVYNLGSGKAVSVFEIVHAFEKAAGKKIPYSIKARRDGDIACSYADVSKAARELGWQPERTLNEACADYWRWQSKNPHGFSQYETE